MEVGMCGGRRRLVEGVCVAFEGRCYCDERDENSEVHQS